MSGFVSLKDVKKIYQMGEVEIMAAAGINFEIQKGEFAVVVGPSGAGKTTVLNILGGMDTATSGQVLVDGEDIARYSQRQLTAYRRDDIGFVFQFYNLIPNLTALENVELALQICKDPMDARQVMREVGLGDRMDDFPAQLSGGEQQRDVYKRQGYGVPEERFPGRGSGSKSFHFLQQAVWSRPVWRRGIHHAAGIRAGDRVRGV